MGLGPPTRVPGFRLSTVPVPAGTFVTHFGKQVHYDGAKDEETIIQVWGMGPATSTPAEKK